jgi:hypothetical protein
MSRRPSSPYRHCNHQAEAKNRNAVQITSQKGKTTSKTSKNQQQKEKEEKRNQ